jgi:type II secretory ATPase GspE/PulE/Tfp pilus assembly ATPase PilB-like protein
MADDVPIPSAPVGDSPASAPPRLISGPGRRIECSGEIARMVAVFDDGTTLVSRAHANDMDVNSVLQQARLKGVVPRPRFCSMEEIARAVHEAAGDGGDAGASTMQRELLQLIAHAAKVRASDIHVIVGPKKASVRARVFRSMVDMQTSDGEPIEWAPEYAHRFITAAYNFGDAKTGAHSPSQFQNGQIQNGPEKRMPDTVESVRMNFNVLIKQDRHLDIRLFYLDRGAEDRSFASLGFLPQQQALWDEMMLVPSGVIYVAGKVNSGKSTTLDTAVRKALRESGHSINIICFEDPPERVIDGALQFFVIGGTSPEERRAKNIEAMRNALRSDPDMLMIGEVRDKESSELVLEAALTGKKVLTTTHATDMVTIVPRLAVFHGDAVHDLTDPTVVVGLVGQRLVQTLCDCKVSYAEADTRGWVPDPVRTNLKRVDVDRSLLYVRNPHGCPHCSAYVRGVRGQTVIAEMVVPDEVLMRHLREADTIAARRHWIEGLGGITMRDHALIRMIEGTIEPAEYLARLGPMQPLSRRDLMASARIQTPVGAAAA